MYEKQKAKTIGSVGFTLSYSQMIMQKEAPQEDGMKN